MHGRVLGVLSRLSVALAVVLLAVGWTPRAMAAPGDVNGDGCVDVADLMLVFSTFGSSTGPTDLVNVLANFGECATRLRPGPGFSGEPVAAVPVGSPGDAGYTATAIARWNVVPHQWVIAPMHVGVIAFHMNGIDRVEFTLDGGEPLVVREKSFNERTGTWEYVATIDPDDFAVGREVEVRALVYPRRAGEPRVVEPLFLHVHPDDLPRPAPVYVSETGDDATADGSRSKPFRTIWAAMKAHGATADISGLTVYLEAGRYSLEGSASPRPFTSDGWVTVRAAPGVERNSVRVGAGRVRVKYLALRDLVIDLSGGGNVFNYPTLEPSLWLDNVVALGPGPAAGTTVTRAQGWRGLYITRSVFTGFRDGAQGATLARDVSLYDLGSDAFGDARLVVNCRVFGIEAPAGSGFHPDVYQFSGAGGVRDNTIVYGLRAVNADAQGLFADDLDRIENAAFVNMEIKKSGPSYLKSQWDVPIDHVLLWHTSIRGQAFFWRTTDYTNLSIKGCVFEKAEGFLNVPSSVGVSNHFVEDGTFGARTFGADATSGDPSPAVLRDRLAEVIVEADIAGVRRYVPDVGPVEFD